MSSHKNPNNPTADKAPTSNGGGHSLRKRQSPNNPTAAGTSSTSATNPESSNLDNDASSSKQRKVSTAAAKSDPSVVRPPGTRELTSLIQPFPNRPIASEERLTRSKAKALKANTSSANSHPKTEDQSYTATMSTSTGIKATSITKSSDSSPNNELIRTANLPNLIPRMQHVFNAAVTGGPGSTSTGTRTISEAITEAVPHYQHYIGSHHHAHSPAMLALVEGLRSSNEIRQSEAASELAEMLLLGNEESLPNMPIVEIVQAICGLLSKDNNFELMLTAIRCIINMQEALPRALPVIAETIPLLLSKLKRIEYIDVAELALTALDVMSKRNGKQILLQGGISSTISHVDFYSPPSQRLCYQIWLVFAH